MSEHITGCNCWECKDDEVKELRQHIKEQRENNRSRVNRCAELTAEVERLREALGVIGEDSPLRTNIEGEELVIRVGITRLDGCEAHPFLPVLDICDREEWVRDVICAMNKEDELGNSPLIELIDRSMVEAIEQGSIGISYESPTHIGECDACEGDCVPLRHTKHGQLCTECYSALRGEGSE